MSCYVVRNGRLELRERDFNVPNYRIIPYKSINNPTHNDYITNTFDQLRQQIQKLKNDYRSLIQTLWRVFSQIDRTTYDPHVMFIGMKSEQIYDKLCLIRGLNACEKLQQSLTLSAIMKVDDNCNLYGAESPRISTEASPQLSIIKQQIKQQSLYQIQEEEECCSNTSKKDIDHTTELPRQSFPQDNQSIQNHNISHGRPSLGQMSANRKDSRRTSFFLKQKISLALNQQQQLRQLLEEELSKITQELDSKNQFLYWTVQQLSIRNQLIEKLKKTLLIRDEALEQQQKLIQIKYQTLEAKKYEQILQEKDKEIGQLINSLIERTQETQEDLQYLAKSLQPTGTIEDEQPSKQDQNNSLDIEELQKSVKEDIYYPLARAPSFGSKDGRRISQQSVQCNNSILKPKNTNYKLSQNITYLTKEHFLEAQKKSSGNFLIENVKMTESVRATPLKSSLVLNISGESSLSCFELKSPTN